MKELKLFCTHCKKEFEIEEFLVRCDICNEPLEVEEIKYGNIHEGNSLKQNIFERYQEFMPFENGNELISMGEGFTPLIKSHYLAEKYSIKNIFFKNEMQNPTWSFKDRGTSACLIHAKELGYKKIGTVSTGNMAASVAAYGRKNKLETFVIINKNMPEEKIEPIAIYEPHLIKYDGDYGNLYYKSLEIGKDNHIYFMNSDVPMRVEGSKTIAFEICEQLDFIMPDYVVVPTSAGGNIRGIEKGFREFKNAGLIKSIPKMIVAQAEGCSPIVKAFENKSERIERFMNPRTIAHAIENPLPPSGNQVLRMLRKNSGYAVSVSEEEIIEAQSLMAKEGIFGQPASAVSLAVVIKIRKGEIITSEDSVVCIVTGSGLKYTEVLKQHKIKTEKADQMNIDRVITELKI
ncbi:MAG: threonine synthase [Clostridiales bacterium]|nr:threonine synthase [Clostridiales bacterium]